MGRSVFLSDLFSAYRPDDAMESILSQLKIECADLDVEAGRVEAAVSSCRYVPAKTVATMEKEIQACYGLKELRLRITYPENLLLHGANTGILKSVVLLSDL